MRKVVLVVVLCFLTACSSYSASLEETLTEMLPRGRVGAPAITFDEEGYCHVVFSTYHKALYAKLDPSGNPVYPEVIAHPARCWLDTHGIELDSRNDRVIALFRVLDGVSQYSLIDDGEAVTTGKFGSGGKLVTCMSPNGDLITWGMSDRGERDNKTVMRKLVDDKGLRIFEIGWVEACKPALGLRFAIAMIEERYLLIYGDPVIIDNTIDLILSEWDKLKVYKFDLYDGVMVDSAIISLVDNPDIIECDVPFQGYQFKVQPSGNALIYTACWIENKDPRLRVINLSPDLEVIPLKSRVIHELESPRKFDEIDSSDRIFWFMLTELSGCCKELHELILTPDTLYHYRLADYEKK